jgi:hypothetical protein
MVQSVKMGRIIEKRNYLLTLQLLNLTEVG